MKKCTTKRYRIRKYSPLWFAKALSPLLIMLLLVGCMSAFGTEEAGELPGPTPVELPEVTEPVVLDEIYWPLTDEERDLVERVVAAEARGESIEGQMAVAQVIMDRAATRNQSITKVCTAPAQFAEPYQGEISEKTRDAVSFVFDKGERPFELVTHFYAWNLIDPPHWTEDKEFVGRIGDHDFFADK